MRDNVSEILGRLHTYKKLPWIIIFIGIVLRLIRYLYNPSLWFDESRNAESILAFSISDFLPPIPDLTTSINVGFILLEKLVVQAFGYSEYALRSLTILSGIASLFLFYWVAKRYIKPNAVLIGLGLFAILDPLIYFSTELKPYMCDMAIALILYGAAAHMQTRKLSPVTIVSAGFIGALAIWISHPAVFVLAGLGITITVSSLIKQEWSKLGKLSIVFSIWAVSFFTVLFLFTLPLIANMNVGSNDLFWNKKNAFMPLPPMSLADIQWYIDILFRTFEFPVGLSLSGIAVLAFLAGCISMWSENREKLFIIISPVIVTLLVTVFHKYTFVQGQILFVVPALLLLTAEGVEYIRDKTSRSAPLIGTVIIILLFIYPATWSAYRAMKPSSREEIKPVLTYVKENWQQGDRLYVYYMSQFAFQYYSTYHPGNFHFEKDQYIIGRGPNDWHSNYKIKEFTGYWDKNNPFTQPYTLIFNDYIKDLNQLKGLKRVWVLFSSIVPKAGIHEEKFFTYYLDTVGEQLDSFGRAGISAVYLYDLSEQAASAE